MSRELDPCTSTSPDSIRAATSSTTRPSPGRISGRRSQLRLPSTRRSITGSDFRAALVVLGAQADLVAEPHQGVVLAIDHALLHRDDRVVGDLDALGADLGAALGDVAHADAGLLLGQLAPVVAVQRVHVELGVPEEEARSREGRLVVLVVT